MGPGDFSAKGDLARRRFEAAMQTREFEVSLFWTRWNFFWLLTAAALAGYGYLFVGGHYESAAVLAAFGMVIAVGWALAARGSKYWYESWERKTAGAEHVALGAALFDHHEPPREDIGRWLRARRFSVSRIAIALSDCAALAWAVLLIGHVLRHIDGLRRAPDLWVEGGALVGAIAMVAALARYTYSGGDEKNRKARPLRWTVTDERIWVRFGDGSEATRAIASIEALSGARGLAGEFVEPGGGSVLLHWPDLDIDLTYEAFLRAPTDELEE